MATTHSPPTHPPEAPAPAASPPDGPAVFFELQRIFRPLAILVEAASETQDAALRQDRYEDVARAAVRFHGDLDELRSVGGLPAEIEAAVTDAAAVLAAISVAALGILTDGGGLARECVNPDVLLEPDEYQTTVDWLALETWGKYSKVETASRWESLGKDGAA